MSHFLKKLQEHQAEIDRMIEQQEQGTPLSYSMMRDMGMLRPFAVRLPIPLIAMLDETVKHGLWGSKQEMVFDMIQSAYLDFFESSSEATKNKLAAIQTKAFDTWEKKNKGRIFNRSTRSYEPREEPKPRGKGRRG